MTADDIFSELRQKLQKAIDHVKSELSLIRTGKATVQLLDPVRVEAYGSSLSLQEVAQVSAPDPTLLTISPYDQSILPEIEKAVVSSGLNLQPVVDKNMIRISIPPLTTERRQEMVKLLNQRIEQGKVMIRTIRTDAKKDIEKQKGQEGVSEDDIKRDVEQLEQVIKEHLDTIDELAQAKEAELMTV